MVSRFAHPIPRIEELQTDVGEIGIGDHQRPGAIANRMPGIERGDPSLHTRVNVDAADPVGPIDKSQFTCAGNPRFMGNPFAKCALVEPTVVAAIPVDHPDAVRKGAGIEKQIGVIRTELKMSNGVTPQDNFALAGDSIDDGVIWAIALSPRSWPNIPASWHNRGDVLSFADGHAEHWRWLEKTTIVAKFPYGAVTSPEDRDFERVRRADTSRD